MTEKAFAASFFAALISMVNPFATMPFYIVFTKDIGSWKLKGLLTVMLLSFVFGALVVCMFFGGDILRFFGISFPAFKVAGAIIISMIGPSMLRGSQDADASHEPIEKKDGGTMSRAIALFPSLVVPLGVPLLVGGGSISVVMVYGIRAQASDELVAVALGVILAVCLTVLVCYLLSGLIIRLLGKHGIDIIVRLFGLVLLGIGVQLFAEGLAGLTINLINPKVL